MAASRNGPQALQKLQQQALAARCAGDLDRAIARLGQAIRLAPKNAELRNTLGVLLAEAGRSEAAVSAWQLAIQLQPGCADAWFNLGRHQDARGQAQAAIASLEAAVAARPGWAAAHHALGCACLNADQRKESIRHLTEAVRLDPEDAEAHRNLALVLLKQDEYDRAMLHFTEAVKRAPETSTLLQFALALPVIYMSDDDVLAHRRRIEQNLAQLLNASLAGPICPVALGALTFPVVYQGLPNRALMEAYAILMQRLVAPVAVSGPAARPPGRRRVAWISAFLRQHTIGRLYARMIADLDREAFEVRVFLVDAAPDELTDLMLAPGEAAVRLPRHLATAAQIVGAWSPDVIHYTDIGMDAETYALAMHRMAPVQCVGWGHPVTTGLPSIDYFISSALIEVAEADVDYSERLVRLPCLPTSYRRADLEADTVSRAELDIAEGRPVFACLQSAFKLHPQFDLVLRSLLDLEPDAIVLLLGEADSATTRALEARLRQQIPLLEDAVRFLPPMQRRRFLGVVQLADAALDPLPYGGGNTSLEALALGTPVVTLPTRYMPGRVTAGIYQQLGVLDAIAVDGNDYVRIARRFFREPDYRADFMRRIEAGLPGLYDTRLPAEEIGRFFNTACDAAASRLSTEAAG